MLKLGDFGLARMYEVGEVSSGLTMQGDYGGTFAFMPPEQITEFRESRPTNDVYAVGATLYNLLSGRYVYDFPSQIERKVLMLAPGRPGADPLTPPGYSCGTGRDHSPPVKRRAGSIVSLRCAMHEALLPHGP